MLLRRFPLLLLATTLTIVATEEASTAFTITPRQPGASIRYRYSDSYSNQRGLTELNSYLWFDPRSIPFAGQVREIARGGTSGLMSKLQPFVDRGWTFNRAENDLSGRFDVEYHYACGVDTNCGQEEDRGKKGGVGSFLSLKYYPSGADPKPGQGKLHWIQRVVSNHNYDLQRSQMGLEKYSSCRHRLSL